MCTCLDLYVFLEYCIATNFLFRTAFVASHKFWTIVLSFSFVSRYFKNFSSLISFCSGYLFDYLISLMQWLFSSILFQFSLVAQSCLTFATPWIAARQASPSITNSWCSLRLTSIESMMPSSHVILRCPLLLLPQIPPSIRVFSKESTLRMR